MRSFLIFLVCLGVVVIFGILGYFPFGAVYHVALDAIFYLDWVSHPIPQAVVDGIRIRITVGAVVIASALFLLMFLLRKASRHLELVLFEKAFTAAMFYVSVMTVLVLAGMWIDFYVGPPITMQNLGTSCRVGFFYSISTL